MLPVAAPLTAALELSLEELTGAGAFGSGVPSVRRLGLPFPDLCRPVLWLLPQRLGSGSSPAALPSCDSWPGGGAATFAPHLGGLCHVGGCVGTLAPEGDPGWGLVSSEEAILDETHIFLSGTLCGGQRHNGNPAGPSPPSAGMKTPCSGRAVWGGGRRLGWVHWGSPSVLAGQATCLQSRCRAIAAGKCGSRPFFPEHLVLYGLAAVSAEGPSGTQPPMPGRGLRLGTTVGRALSPSEVPMGPGLAKCVPSSSRPGVHSWILWGCPGKGSVLRRGRSQPCLLAEARNEGQCSGQG